MGKIQFCRICRTKENLKFTAKTLREFNRKQQLCVQKNQGSIADKASQKLLRSTPTLGNICKDCDDRIQIFHRLDDANQCSDSDIEIDVVDSTVTSLPPTASLPAPITNCRPDTPIIVDDDDMLYDLFMQKVDQQRQQRQLPILLPQIPIQNEPQQPHQAFIAHFNSQYTPPQSTGGSEGEDAKVIEVLTSRESTPALSICTTVTPVPAPVDPPDIVDNQGHRIVAIINLDDGDEDITERNNREQVLTPPPVEQNHLEHRKFSQIVVAQAKFQTEKTIDNQIQLTPIKTSEGKTTAQCEDDDEEIVFRRVEHKEKPTPTKKKSYSQVFVSQSKYQTEKPIDNHIAPIKTSPAKIIPQTEEDEEEIVFRRVVPEDDTTPSKKKKRKSYDEKQLRLVASLSLVSSDSETEDSSLKSSPAKPNVFTCKECHINLPDKESLSVHERVHEGVKCPVCHFGFPHEKRLVHHMRYKHRAYDGNVLSEKPRAPQDSAMTIRLRYMQHLTFYECQLCGRIDEVFKDHKDHVINKHPIESKTLKDPIMKQLKCPICKTKCGTQYLSLCRHLLAKHEYGQYKSHLREIMHVSGFGLNAARQQEVSKTARIYQFSKRKSFFFECKICRKVVNGHLNHMKHISFHSKLELKEKTEPPPSPPPMNKATNTKTKTVKSKLGKILNSTKKSKQISKTDSKSFKKPAKPIEKSQNVKKSTISKKSHAVKLKTPKNKTKESIKSADKPVTVKPKTREAVKTNEKSIKRKRKESQSTKPQLKKVKVKAPIKQINLQTYTCKYCLQQLKGFILYMTHIRQEHVETEFKQCTKCSRSYLEQAVLTTHIEQCSLNKQKRKRDSGERSRETSNSRDTNCKGKLTRKDAINVSKEQTVPSISTNKATNVKNVNIPSTSESENEKHTLWLKDLLKFNESRKDVDSDTVVDSSSTTLTETAAALYKPHPKEPGEEVIQQCCYCLHLFASLVALEDHTTKEHSKEDEILIKYTPYKP